MLQIWIKNVKKGKMGNIMQKVYTSEEQNQQLGAVNNNIRFGNIKF